MHEEPKESVVLKYFSLKFGSFLYRGVKFFFKEILSKNYLLLGNYVGFLENAVQMFWGKSDYNINMLSIYIVYILNPLVIEIKNIFIIIISIVSLTRLKTKQFFHLKNLRQTSQ